LANTKLISFYVHLLCTHCTNEILVCISLNGTNETVQSD
jgi:hypothetical protein